MSEHCAPNGGAIWRLRRNFSNIVKRMLKIYKNIAVEGHIFENMRFRHAHWGFMIYICLLELSQIGYLPYLL